MRDGAPRHEWGARQEAPRRGGPPSGPGTFRAPHRDGGGEHAPRARGEDHGARARGDDRGTRAGGEDRSARAGAQDRDTRAARDHGREWGRAGGPDRQGGFPRGAGGPQPDRLPPDTGRPAVPPRPDRDHPPGEGRLRGPQPSSRFPNGRFPAGPAPAPGGAIWLYGHHAVAAALANPARRLRRLLLTEEGEVALAAVLAKPWSLAPERTERPRLDHLLGRETVHQGVALLADPLAPPPLAQLLDRPGPVLVLDQVTDPRNVGAILRAAAAFGAAGVITQDRNAPEETGSLAKAASGALETVPLLRAVNIARTLIALKAADRWVVGLDAGSQTPLTGAALAGRKVALVLGAEGTGLRRLTRETCDELAGLATAGVMASLNVSAAAAVALYELVRHP